MKLRYFFILEQLRVIRRFYLHSFAFFFLDIAMGGLYFFINPYRVCRRFFQKKGEEFVHVYGETPLMLWEVIAKNAEINSSDCLIDLGCGRGRLCFWTSLWIGCSTTGVDWVPFFIRYARFFARLFKIHHLRFECNGISQISLENATIVYLYTYHPEEEKIDFHQLRSGARVITVSEPLLNESFVISKTLTASFPWGDTEVFINKKL